MILQLELWIECGYDYITCFIYNMSYYKYNKSESCSKGKHILDLNTISPCEKISTFPDMKGDVVLHPAYYICPNAEGSSHRDKKTHYLYTLERHTHTPYFSRYGYARNSNGYGFGNMPGKYSTSYDCQCEKQPIDVAPSRFYTSTKTTNPTHVVSSIVRKVL